jgi:FtsP/CotA-like multicopper oxidase with cupredoxin domain
LDGSPIAPALAGARFGVAASDGREIAGAAPLDSTRVGLGMGERADLVFTMPESCAVRLVAGIFRRKTWKL